MANKARSKEAWKAAKRHEIILPSGTEVAIEIPNLPKLIKAGQIPNNLLDAAIGAQSGELQITADLIKEQWDFYTYLVARTVVDPVLEEADVSDIPYEDVEMLVEIATRNRDMDAVGRHLAGLDKQESFRKFRGLDRSDSTYAGL